MQIPRTKEVLKEEIKVLLTRLLETITDKWIDLRTPLFGFESVHVKRRTPEYHLAVRVAEDSIRDIEDLLKTLSNQF